MSRTKKCIVPASAEANKAANQLVELITKAKPDLIVNTAGTAGGAAGAAVAGPIGSIAGDFIASTAAKHTLLLTEAYDKVKDSDDFKSASSWQKASQVLKQARAPEAKKDAAQEVEGFAIGNISAAILSNIPAIGGLPMKGAIAASILVPAIQKAKS